MASGGPEWVVSYVVVRPIVLISTSDLGWISGGPTSSAFGPGIHLGRVYREAGWVVIFCLDTDRTTCLDIWSGYRGFGCGYSHGPLHQLRTTNIFFL